MLSTHKMREGFGIAWATAVMASLWLFALFLTAPVSWMRTVSAKRYQSKEQSRQVKNYWETIARGGAISISERKDNMDKKLMLITSIVVVGTAVWVVGIAYLMSWLG